MLREALQTVERTVGVSVDVPEDFRRRRPLFKTRLMRLAVVLEPDDASLVESLELDESSEELDVSKTSCKRPGCDSSSITCCGVLWYM